MRWVETWLDENPEFFRSYLLRKGTRSMVDSWLVAHALPPGLNSAALEEVSEELLEDDGQSGELKAPCNLVK